MNILGRKVMAHPELILEGRETEKRFEALLLWNNIEYWKVGQENWLPKWIHQKIAYKYDDDVEMVRHFPDIATNNLLINVKGALKCIDYPTVTVEQSSFKIANRLYELGINVILVWEFPDHKFRGNFVNKLTAREPNTPREELNGSKTPMYIIRKDDLVEWKDLKGYCNG